MIERNNSDFNAEKIQNFAQTMGTDDFTAAVLLSRGICTSEQAKRFLFPTTDDLVSPFSYSNVYEGAKRICHAVLEKQKILIYGDYDCDGIGAITIFMRAFRENGVVCDYYIPVRADEGYGLNVAAVHKIKSESNPDLIITADCGIQSVEEIALMKELGMDVIVTDHHKPGRELPACITVNPCLNPELTPLCGAGVALYMIRAVFGDHTAFRLFDICALSTVADIVPLTGDNRIIVKFGLKQIRDGNAKIGIKELLYKTSVLHKKVSSYDIAFKLAPRLNAAGRLTSAHSSFALLNTDDPTEARFLAEELDLQNAERQDIGKRIIESAMAELKNYDFAEYRIIVLQNSDWSEGVIGIAAAKITEYFHLPTVLMTTNDEGLLKGSARSIGGVNLYDAIASCSPLLLSFGGHAMAAGLKLNADNFVAFKKGINAFVSALPDETFARKTTFDYSFPMQKAENEHFALLELLEPFGYQNPNPVFLDEQSALKFNRISKSAHIKAHTSNGEAVGFNRYSQLNLLNGQCGAKILYTFGKNYFNGRETNQFRIKNVEFSQFSLDMDSTVARFLVFSHECRKNISKKTDKKQDFPTLHVCFSETRFREAMTHNPHAKPVFGSMDTMLLHDTVVLSPDIDFPFAYYGKILLWEKVTEDIKLFFSAFHAEYAEQAPSVADVEITIDNLRKTYLLLRGEKESKTAYALEEGFKSLRKKGYEHPYSTFIVEFYTFLDVGLLIWEDSGILKNNHQKVDLSISSIYRYFNGTNT